MWSGTLKDVEDNCHWGISIMEGFIANDKMRAHCQGYYRDTYIDEYVLFCEKINSMEKAKVVKLRRIKLR